MGIKRQFSRDFKLSVLKDLETKRLTEVCRAHNIAPSTVSGWRKDYEANPKEAFNGKGHIWKEDAKIAQYERLIGQLYAEVAFLKKVYERLKQQAAEERREER
jgi:transposase